MPQHGPPGNTHNEPQGAPPQGAAPPPQEPAASAPGQNQIQPAEAQGGEDLLEPIQQMSDMIVQLAGPEMLAQVLQQGLDQLMNSAADQQGQAGPPPGQPPVEEAPQPGAGFGPQG